MAITHANATREAIGNLIDDLVNAGTADTGGDLRLRDDTALVVEIEFAATAFGAANGTTGMITLAGTPLSGVVGAAADGTVDNFQIRSKDNAVVLSGTVTGSGGGGDIEMDNPILAEGQTVNLTSLTYTPPT